MAVTSAGCAALGVFNPGVTPTASGIPAVAVLVLTACATAIFSTAAFASFRSMISRQGLWRRAACPAFVCSGDWFHWRLQCVAGLQFGPRSDIPSQADDCAAT